MSALLLKIVRGPVIRSAQGPQNCRSGPEIGHFCLGFLILIKAINYIVTWIWEKEPLVLNNVFCLRIGSCPVPEFTWLISQSSSSCQYEAEDPSKCNRKDRLKSCNRCTAS